MVKSNTNQGKEMSNVATEIAASLNSIARNNGDAAAMFALGELLGQKLEREIAAANIDPNTVTKSEIFNFVFDTLDALRSS
jgi:glutamate-1-semialdehyde aminotransferase